jgi:hypothetical protein
MGSRRLWNSNCWFSFWWLIPLLALQIGATEEYNGSSWTAGGTGWLQQEDNLAGFRNSNSRSSFWWLCWFRSILSATEEYDGQLGQLVEV